ncbi:hypothetical protein OG884_00675 [Streptosporangium sp. NBC_01755]|uniref:hypothetical protein n=1 Tax=unclassified Streptosporangium TaxID=2632669 RepID=UPI002DDB2DA5|nr:MULTISPECIES: hypothetical protein [unclassified Streptosporangium]WSA28038.1 hypothetical protein OIE13_09290 [Streptosporangium sp. NBC_01810]WSD00490.1 hypothetical protein OG884_00675 [Streptosporangium sp. NBC_01755]
MPVELPKAVLAPAAGALLSGITACGNESDSGSTAAGAANDKKITVCGGRSESPVKGSGLLP